MGGVKRAHQDDTAAGGDNVHPSRKRRVEYSEADAQLAKIYNDLADDVQTVRINAAGDLIKNLSIKSDQRLNRIDVAITRLIKGLCSGRKAARLGFSIALAEVLRLAFAGKQPDFSLGSVVDKILELTVSQGNVSGQERRDYMLGRRFAFQATLQSNVGVSATTSLSDWQVLLRAVLDLAAQKQWLRRECGAMLFEYLVAQGRSISADRLQAVVDEVSAKSLWKTPEGVALWLCLGKLPGVKLPKGTWHHNDPLSAHERGLLAKVLQEVPVDDDRGSSKTSASGARQASPSFAWSVILTELCRNGRSIKDLIGFWSQVVDAGLFNTSASQERKALGLQIVSLGVSSVPPIMLSELFTPNVLHCIVTSRAENQRYLFEASKAPLLALTTRCKQNPGNSSQVVHRLLPNGAVNFDQATKTKTVEALLAQASPAELSEIVSLIEDMSLRPKAQSSEQSQVESRRRMLADLTLTLLRSKKEPSDLVTRTSKSQVESVAWLSAISDLFIKLGYDDASDRTNAEASPPFSDASRAMYRARLSSCASHIITLPVADASPVLYGMIKSLRASKSAKVPEQSGQDIKGLLKRTDKAMAKAARTADDKDVVKADTGRVFVLLFAVSVLQVYNDEADAVAALEDLHTCVKDWGKNEDSASVLIELLLSFVSRQSALFRKLAEQAFTAFSASLNADGLQSMLDILAQKESLGGQQELFDQDGQEDDAKEDSGDDETSAMDVDDMSDVEVVNGEQVAADSASSEESSDDDEDADDDDDDDDEKEDEEGEEDTEELAAFNKKLADALGNAGLDENGEEEDDDSDMDDEQMMAVEPALANVFKELKKKTDKKQENKDAKDNIVNFKNRVLDLLSIYVKAQYSNVLALDLLMPLTVLIRTTGSKPTAERAFAVLKQYFECCNKNKSLPDLDDPEVIFALLASVHEEMAKDGSKLHANACSRSSLFLAKILTSQSPDAYERVSSMYAALQQKWWLDPKSKIHSSVFTEWTSWSIATRKQT